MYLLGYEFSHLGKSGESELYYVGHSQGTMMIWAGVSENPFLMKKIKLVFALAPVARLKNIYSPIAYLSYFDSAIKMVSEVLGIREFMPSSEAVREIAEKGCPLYEKVCDGVLEVISGYNKADLNQTRTPVSARYHQGLVKIFGYPGRQGAKISFRKKWAKKPR